MRRPAQYAGPLCLVALLLAALGGAGAQTGGERMLLSLSKGVSRLTWFGEDTVLASLRIGSERQVAGEIALINIRTGEIRTLAEGYCASPSPDRTRVAWIPSSRPFGDIWILDMRTRQRRKLTEEVNARCVTWSPDGRRMAVTATSAAWPDQRVVIVSAETGRTEEVIDGGRYTTTGTLTDYFRMGEPTWQVDGQRIVFPIWAYEIRSHNVIVIGRETMVDYDYNLSRYVTNRIDAFSLRDRRRSEVLTVPREDAAPTDLAYSPDGRVLLVVVGYQITAWDGGAPRVVVSSGLPVSPAWTADGRSILFTRSTALYAIPFP